MSRPKRRRDPNRPCRTEKAQRRLRAWSSVAGMSSATVTWPDGQTAFRAASETRRRQYDLANCARQLGRRTAGLASFRAGVAQS